MKLKGQKEKLQMEERVPLRLYMVRHGQHSSGRSAGELGGGLTNLGKRQALRVAKRLRHEKFDHIYISDLKRAAETALAITKEHPDTPRTVTPLLREILPYHFVPLPEPEDARTAGLLRKQIKAVNEMAVRLKKNHKPGETVLIVGHANLFRTLIPILGKRNPRECILLNLSNASVTILNVWFGGEVVLSLSNCTKHLLDSQVTD